MKKLLVALIVLLLAVGIAVWYFVSFHLDGVIQQKIVQAGSSSLGTQVSVGTVRTDIRAGSLVISDITVPNPPGFRNPYAFTLRNIEAAVDYGSLEVRRVVIDNPEIVIEELGGETNISRMLQEVEATPSEPAGPGAEEPIIVVRHFRMNESRAAFESESLDRYADLEIGAVELNDIRGTPAEVAKLIATEVLSEIAAEAATELLKAQARKKFQDVEDKVSDKLKDLLGGDEDSDDG